MWSRLLHLLAHVTSQLCHRWLPPPPLPPLSAAFWLDADAGRFRELDPSTAWSALGPADWGDLIRWLAEREGSAEWLRRWLERGDRRGVELAAATHQLVSDTAEAGGELITLCDARYPERLAAIADPPLVLSTLGDVQLLATPAEAVVGSRQASALALRESFALGRLLAAAGIVVVSGGALGCDIAAHRGVLAAPRPDARAIVVFAGGLASLYPRANASWFGELRRRGAVFVSERLWRAPCKPRDFPARNRIVSGLSRRIYVMQAAHRSGALITARLGLDQGRDVAVLLHPPGDVRAAGGAELLGQGALAFAEASEALRASGEVDDERC